MLLAPWTLAVAISAPAASPVSLEWQAPVGCPGATAVTAMTRDLLRERPPDPSRPPLVARAVVTRTDRFHVALDLRGPEGAVQRTLAASDCKLLARGVALLIAVHLDPLAVSQVFGRPALITADDPPPSLPPSPPQLPPEPEPEPPPEPVTPPPTPLDEPELPTLTRPPEPPPQPVPPTSFGGHLRHEGGLDYGVLPRLGGDVALVGGVGSARWRVDLGLVGTPNRTTLATSDGVIGRFHRLGGLARGCAVWRVPPRRDLLALLGCLGAEFGGIHATTVGARPSPRWTPWGAALIGGAARATLIGPLGLWFGVEAVIALNTPAFTTGAADTELFTATRAGFRANFGFDLQFVARKRRAATTD